MGLLQMLATTKTEVANPFAAKDSRANILASPKLFGPGGDITTTHHQRRKYHHHEKRTAYKT